MMLLKRTIIAAAKTMTMCIISMIPHAILAALIPSTRSSALVYLFLTLDKACKDSTKDLTHALETNTAVPEQVYVTPERVLLGSVGCVMWLGLETVCTGGLFSLLFMPFLGYILGQTIMDVVFLTVVASMEGLTYAEYVGLLKEFVCDITRSLETLQEEETAETEPKQD